MNLAVIGISSFDYFFIKLYYYFQRSELYVELRQHGQQLLNWLLPNLACHAMYRHLSATKIIQQTPLVIPIVAVDTKILPVLLMGLVIYKISYVNLNIHKIIFSLLECVPGT
jgi:hypothetical protein